MLSNRDLKDSQRDVEAVGHMVLECLEPSTFLRKGNSLVAKTWPSDVLDFVEATKTKSATEILQVRMPRNACTVST
jgi:hypothetical protein